MIPLIPLLCKRKRFRIAEDKAVTEFIEYDDVEEGRISVAKIDFWSSASNAVSAKFPKPKEVEYIQAFLAAKFDGEVSKETETIENYHNMESLQYAMAECHSLVALTSELVSRENMGYEIRSGSSIQPRGLPLPSDQYLAHFKSEIASVKAIISRGLSQGKELSIRRTKYLAGIAELKRYWKTISNLNHTPGSSMARSAGNRQEIVYVDCGAEGIDFKKQKDSLVPLEMGEMGPTLAVREDEHSPRTIQMTLQFIDNLHPHQRCNIATVHLWSTVKNSRSASTASESYSSQHLQVIHNYLTKKQHDAFSSRLFDCILSDARLYGNSYAVTGSFNNQGYSGDAMNSRLDACLLNENVSGAIDIVQLGTLKCSFRLSECFAIAFELVDIASLQEEDGVSVVVHNDAEGYGGQKMIHLALQSAAIQMQSTFLHRVRISYQDRKPEFKTTTATTTTTTTSTVPTAAFPTRASKQTSKKALETMFESDVWFGHVKEDSSPRAAANPIESKTGLQETRNEAVATVRAAMATASAEAEMDAYGGTLVMFLLAMRSHIHQWQVQSIFLCISQLCQPGYVSTSLRMQLSDNFSQLLNINKLPSSAAATFNMLADGIQGTIKVGNDVVVDISNNWKTAGFDIKLTSVSRTTALVDVGMNRNGDSGLVRFHVDSQIELQLKLKLFLVENYLRLMVDGLDLSQFVLDPVCSWAIEIRRRLHPSEMKSTENWNILSNSKSLFSIAASLEETSRYNGLTLEWDFDDATLFAKAITLIKSKMNYSGKNGASNKIEIVSQSNQGVVIMITGQFLLSTWDWGRDIVAGIVLLA